ncbi:hypothetical protein GCM10010344_65100 [Streptomyces bluensis]|nr:hypothetical protein GCM10010344_65100 [Streptomyces bluensis]
MRFLCRWGVGFVCRVLMVGGCGFVVACRAVPRAPNSSGAPGIATHRTTSRIPHRTTSRTAHSTRIPHRTAPQRPTLRTAPHSIPHRPAPRTAPHSIPHRPAPRTAPHRTGIHRARPTNRPQAPAPPSGARPRTCDGGSPPMNTPPRAPATSEVVASGYWRPFGDSAFSFRRGSRDTVGSRPRWPGLIHGFGGSVRSAVPKVGQCSLVSPCPP